MSRRLICPPLPCTHRLYRYAHPDGIDDDSVYIAPTAAPVPEEAGCDTQTSADFLQVEDMPQAIECLTTTSLDNTPFCNKEKSVTVAKKDTIAPPCVVTQSFTLLEENLMPLHKIAEQLPRNVGVITSCRAMPANFSQNMSAYTRLKYAHRVDVRTQIMACKRNALSHKDYFTLQNIDDAQKHDFARRRNRLVNNRSPCYCRACNCVPTAMSVYAEYAHRVHWVPVSCLAHATTNTPCRLYLVHRRYY